MAQNMGIRIHQYLDNWLVRATSQETCLHHTRAPVAKCQELGWIVNMEKLELEPKQIFDFVCYQCVLREGTLEHLKTLSLKIQKLLTDVLLLGQTTQVPPRPFGSYRKASPTRLASHEADSVAPEKSLEDPTIQGKDDPHSKISPPTLKMVTQRNKCLLRTVRSSDLYRCLEKRLGH